MNGSAANNWPRFARPECTAMQARQANRPSAEIAAAPAGLDVSYLLCNFVEMFLPLQWHLILRQAHRVTDQADRSLPS